MIESSKKNKILDKLARYLAIRDHSVQELKDKLIKNFDEQEINQAIEYADKAGWLVPEEELSQKVASRLNSKYKGRRYINKYLSTKGLPKVEIEEDMEISKARKLIRKKFYNKEPMLKVYRFLCSQGYDSSIARRVVHEKL